MSGPACLLLHGFGGTTFEMESLKDYLEQAGYTVKIPLLPGHGSNINEWAVSGWDDWSTAALNGYDELALEHKDVFVAGLSMGGALTLWVASRRRPTAICCLAAPLRLWRLGRPFFPHWALPLLPVAKYARPFWPGRGRSAQAKEIEPWEGYEEALSMAAVSELQKGLKKLRKEVWKVAAPILCIHSPKDRIVEFYNSPEILRRVGSHERRLISLPISDALTTHHGLTTHAEVKGTVFKEVTLFFNEMYERG